MDAAGQGDFTIIQEAVDAAADGDTVLVRPWYEDGPRLYDGFELADRELDVVGEADAKVRVRGFVVRDLAPGRTASVSNLMVGYPEEGWIQAVNCGGAVRFAEIDGWLCSASIDSCVGIRRIRRPFAG